MAQIKYQVPYEIRVFAKDLGSGKAISNIWYYRCGAQVGSIPAYGADIAGPSDNLAFLNNFVGAYNATITPLLNHNYSETQFQSQAIVGKRYGSPLIPIVAVTLGIPVTINTATPHGLSTGNTISIQGVTTPGSLNVFWGVTVTTPTQFVLNGSDIAGLWSGDGYFQRVRGNLEFLYADKVTTFTGLATGGVAGDALPLFACASVRRLNAGIGRQFRSRVSLSPMSEAGHIDGTWTGATQTAFATALAGLIVPILNGGSDTGSRLMYQQAVSKQKAFQQTSPFTFQSFSQNVNAMTLQPNCGSLVRRKPKLTSAIT